MWGKPIKIGEEKEDECEKGERKMKEKWISKKVKYSKKKERWFSRHEQQIWRIA
jgi:hypothetical protein